jgi:hypothetical protein
MTPVRSGVVPFTGVFFNDCFEKQVCERGVFAVKTEGTYAKPAQKPPFYAEHKRTPKLSR